MKKIICFAFLCFLLSCTGEDDILNESGKVQLSSETVTVLQERNPNYPLEYPLRVKTRGAVNSSSDVNNFLGYSYNLKSFPLGTALNVGYPIVDVAKLKAEEGSYVTDDRYAGVQDVTSFSYSTFDRYTYKSKDTEKVVTGFNLDFKLFSIGNKNTIETIYSKDIINEKQRVFGQLNARVCGRRYSIAMSSNLKKKIKQKYLQKTFIDEIHSITTNEFVEIYGPFVLINYFTGGRLTAMYSGIYIGNDVTDTKEKNIDIDINASYGPGSDTIGGKVNVGIGSKYYRQEMTSKKISNMEVSVKAVGGNLNYATFTTPQNIANVNIDLSRWMSSLTPETYRMIDIDTGGLVPLSEFVIEYNLRSHLERYLSSGNSDSDIKYFQEPYIEIIRREVQGLRLLIPILKAKNGDGVLLSGAILLDPTDSESTIQTKIQQIKNEKAKIFGLKFTTRKYVNDIEPLLPDWTFDIGLMECGENVFSKYIDKENNILYLLYNNPQAKALNNAAFSLLSQIIGNSKLKISAKGNSGAYPQKVGWSFYDYNRSLNLYGLTDFVQKLPEIKVDSEELLNYQLIAL